ncbi:SpoIIE family protein phosphatase [Janthinobacterium aquaticum]|nr:SpoIIE family protein phosphatase [Janthinobacterium sp. FT58W]
METVLMISPSRPDYIRQEQHVIAEASDVAAARRAGNALARAIGFDEVRTGQLAILITEAGTNILKHANSGEILLRKVLRAGAAGIEVLAIDKGPGISNVARHMQDGHSTAGSYGVGLGAMRRLSQQFDLYTLPGQGTVLLMVIWGLPAAGVFVRPVQWQVGAVCLPLASEEISGDAWNAVCEADEITVMMADGLGHGPLAAEPSETAAVLLEQAAPGLAPLPASFLQLAHGALRSTRGAAMGVTHIDAGRGELRFAGVGNISGYVIGHGHERNQRHLLSHNGIVGTNLRKVQEFVHPWQADSLLLMHSDGLHTRWDLDLYPGLLRCHPSLIAAVMYRDFSRQRDDVSVVVARQMPPEDLELTAGELP